MYTVTDEGRRAGEEQVGVILCCAEREILQYKYEYLTRL